MVSYKSLIPLALTAALYACGPAPTPEQRAINEEQRQEEQAKQEKIIAREQLERAEAQKEERIARLSTYDFADSVSMSGQKALAEAYDTNLSAGMKKMLELPPGSELPVYQCFMLDASGSMDGKILNKAGERVSKPDVIKNYPYPEGSHIYVFTTELGKYEEKSLKDVSATGGTPMLSAAYQVLKVDACPVLNIMTDGDNNDEVIERSDLVEYANKQGTRINIFAYGLDSDHKSYLEKITNPTGGKLIMDK